MDIFVLIRASEGIRAIHPIPNRGVKRYIRKVGVMRYIRPKGVLIGCVERMCRKVVLRGRVNDHM